MKESFKTVDLTKDNLDECLNNDVIFVQYFNTFLALPVSILFLFYCYFM